MFEVILTQRAEEELEQAHDWLVKNRSPQLANRWYEGFIRAMLSLENDPDRYPLASENEHFSYEVRQLNYGLGGKPSHRALYAIHRDKVVILRVRHLAQRLLSSEDT